MSDIFQTAELKVPLQQDFLPIVLSYIEEASTVFKMSRQDATQLVLATEEIFSFLVYNAKRADILYLAATTKGSCMEVTAKFASEMLPVQAMNLTTKIAADDDSALGSMGLLIAARSVDSLSLSIDNDGYMHLNYTKNKQYNKISPIDCPVTHFSGDYVAEDIDASKIPLFCAHALAEYGASDADEFLRYPQKLNDIITKGNFDGCFAVDSQGQVAGALFWEANGEMINGKGFFIFAKDDKEKVAKVLMNGCQNRTFILQPHCLFLEHATLDTPLDFLRLGRTAAYLPMYAGDKPATIYINSDLVPYAKDFYRKIGVIRNIYEQMPGNAISSIPSENSAFAISIDKVYKEVKISTLWIGKDAVENLHNHINVLRAEGMASLIFDLAIEKPEDAIMSSFLLQVGFKPEVIIPWTKDGDILRFVYDLNIHTDNTTA